MTLWFYNRYWTAWYRIIQRSYVVLIEGSPVCPKRRQKSFSGVVMFCWPFCRVRLIRSHIFNHINVWGLCRPHKSWNIIFQFVVLRNIGSIYRGIVILIPVRFVANMLSNDRKQMVFQDWNIFFCIYSTIDKAKCSNMLCNPTP